MPRANKSERADLVVIGAGIQGASAAFYATQAGLRRLIVIEGASAAGQGATAASAAMIMHQTGDARTSLAAKLSLERYYRFSDEVGCDVGLRQTGSIIYADAGSPRCVELRSMAADHLALGIDTRVVDGGSIAELTRGFLADTERMVGTHCSRDGYVHAPSVLEGYLEAAKRSGASVRYGTLATGIMLNGGRVEAVQLANGERITTDKVLNCAGWGARAVGDWVGHRVPLKRNHRNMLVLRGTPELPTGIPIVEDLEREWYFRPHSEGVLLGVGPTRWLDNDSQEAPVYDNFYHAETLDYVRRASTAFASVDVLSAWAGHRPMIDPCVAGAKSHSGDPGLPDDDLPLVGAVAGIEGYYESCGWGAFGVTLAPIGGELAVSTITGGQPPVDPAPFNPMRFEGRQ